MKLHRLIFSILVLLFGFSLVLFSSIRLSSKATEVRAKSKLAEQKKAEDAQNAEIAENARTEATEAARFIQEDKEVDYYLPYPGILPDHPLYWLKMIRDRVRLWLTKDVEARFERLILYADKRIGAAKALIEGGQADLGVTTVTKAGKYLEQATFEFEKVKKAGKAYPERIELLEKAIAKHEEVLCEVKEKVSDQSKSIIDQAIEKTQMQQEKVKEKFEEK